MSHVFADIIQIEMLQASVAGIMEQNQKGHHFGVRHLAITMIFMLSLRVDTSYSAFGHNAI